jgi:hypothetical protein
MEAPCNCPLRPRNGVLRSANAEEHARRSHIVNGGDGQKIQAGDRDPVGEAASGSTALSRKEHWTDYRRRGRERAPIRPDRAGSGTGIRVLFAGANQRAARVWKPDGAIGGRLQEPGARSPADHSRGEPRGSRHVSHDGRRNGGTPPRGSVSRCRCWQHLRFWR